MSIGRSRSGPWPKFDPSHLRGVYGAFPTGVAAVAAVVDGRPVGIVVSSFTSVSLDPALVSVCVGKSSETWPVLTEVERLGVSVLSSVQQQVCRQLADKSGDRFGGLTWRSSPRGAVRFDGASAWFECSIERQIDVGDHDIVVLRVHDLNADARVAPLVFHASRFRCLNTSGEISSDPSSHGGADEAAVGDAARFQPAPPVIPGALTADGPTFPSG